MYVPIILFCDDTVWCSVLHSMLQVAAVCYNAGACRPLPYLYMTHCVVVCCGVLLFAASRPASSDDADYIATHYSTLQHAATHSNTLQHSATQFGHSPVCHGRRNT